MKLYIGVLLPLLVTSAHPAQPLPQNAQADDLLSEPSYNGPAWVETNTYGNAEGNFHRITIEKYVKNVKKCRKDSDCYVKLGRRPIQQRYGYYCGKGHYTKNKRPLDPVDMCCKLHDETRGNAPIKSATDAAKCLSQIDTANEDKDFANFGKGTKGNMEEARLWICKRMAEISPEVTRSECSK